MQEGLGQRKNYDLDCFNVSILQANLKCFQKFNRWHSQQTEKLKHCSLAFLIQEECLKTSAFFLPGGITQLVKYALDPA